MTGGAGGGRQVTQQRTCAECRYDGGQHFSEDGSRSWRCPNYQAVEQAKIAAAVMADATQAATEAARLIVSDAARRCYEFNSNTIRVERDAADLPGSVMGPAFVWAASDKATSDGPLIEATGRFVQSTDPGTRHRVQVWRSRVYRGQAKAS